MTSSNSFSDLSKKKVFCLGNGSRVNVKRAASCIEYATDYPFLARSCHHCKIARSLTETGEIPEHVKEILEERRGQRASELAEAGVTY